MLLGAQRLNDQRPIINYRPVSKKRSGSDLLEIGSNITDEQSEAIVAALTPEELVRLLKFIEEKTGIPLDPDPPDVVSPDPSAEPVQVVGSVTDVAGS